MSLGFGELSSIKGSGIVDVHFSKMCRPIGYLDKTVILLRRLVLAASPAHIVLPFWLIQNYEQLSGHLTLPQKLGRERTREETCRGAGSVLRSLLH